MTLRHSSSAFAIILSVGAMSASASAQTADPSATVEGTDLVVRDAGRESRVALGCAGGAFIRQGARAYVACRPAGVVEVDLTDPASPRRAGLLDAGGEVAGFFLVDGAVWARINRVEGRPVDALAARPETAAPLPTTTASVPGVPERQPSSGSGSARVGGVVSAGLGDVVVDLGSADGLSVGGHVELYRERWTRLDAGERALRLEPVAVGEISTLSTRRARVRLGSGERASVGARARSTAAALTHSTMAPPRVEGIWEIHGGLRPFLSLEYLSVGALADAGVVYRAAGPWAIHVAASPVAFVVGQQPVFNYNLMVTGGYDSRWFELGLGVGAASYRDNDDGEPADTFAFGQYARLGTRDGVHFEVQNNFLLGRDRFRFGSVRGSLQIPVSSAAALVFGGGGGVTGYAFGEAGLRIRVRGNGDHGSLYLTPSVGGVSVVGGRGECVMPFGGFCYASRVEHGGPLVGIGVEYRP